MKISFDGKQILANVVSKLATSSANNATFDYIVYQAAMGYNQSPYFEIRSLFEAQPNYAEINKNGTYEQRLDLAKSVHAQVYQ